MPMLTFGVYLAVVWWSTWYPGAEPGGGGYVAQRIFSAKNERHGVLATLWFNVAHYALRPWPWILTALAAVVLYTDLPDADKGAGYLQTIMDPDVFPASLRGVMLAAFAAAYMSTVGTQLNWGASYVINDFYRRFLVRQQNERHYVLASQIVTVILMVLSLIVTSQMKSIEVAWKVLMVTGAGTGLVLISRWYWWRINAWSEVAAMVVAAVVSLYLQLGGPTWNADDPYEFAYLMLTTVVITTVAWILVTLITPAEPRETLVAFYRRVRPAGPGWKPIAALVDGSNSSSESLAANFTNWILGCLLIYASLFAIGKLIFKEWTEALVCIVVALVAAIIISRNLAQADWEEAEIAD
jgi:Na+/proline symporter